MLTKDKVIRNESPRNIYSSLLVMYPLLVLHASCFAILYAVWFLPGTIALRNICLFLGAMASVYPIYQARHDFFRKTAIPVWLLAAVFAWAIFHLLFLTQDPILQYKEFASIWKRSFIGAIFALGFGISLSAAMNSSVDSYGAAAKHRICWAACRVIAYTGLVTPVATYLIKFGLAAYGAQLGITIPHSLQSYVGTNSYYIPKTAYVCFCLPTLATGLGLLYANITNGRLLSLTNLIYVASIAGVIAIFNEENIKNGYLYALLLVGIFIICLSASSLKKFFLEKLFLIILFSSAVIFLLMSHLNKNESWRALIADTKIAWQIDQYPHWKSSGQQGYPINEHGTAVSVTNYERIAWAKVGMGLIVENPLGYGLVERSFGHFSARQWPGTHLTQSHSGWIDLTLGIGIPGLGFILSVIFILLYRLSPFGAQINSIDGVIWWIVLATLLMWCTTEISQKVFFDSLIFWLALGAGLTLRLYKQG